MNKLLILIIFLYTGCNTSEFKSAVDLSSNLNEVSGTETTTNSNLIWMVNDSGNKPRLFGLNANGKIKEELKIDAKNHDWEDLTSDTEGNIYIGDFGNNISKRKNLAILKVSASSLKSKEKVSIERISFTYPDQKKFPPKKKKLYFDCEAFFYHNNNLYLFTKSRVKGDFGKTNLYKIPANSGTHEAQFLGTYSNCDDLHCWITSADISPDGKQVVLLNQKSVLLFTDFKEDDFLNGTIREFPFNYESQKEGICFKDNQTVYITDEKAHGAGGNLYEFRLK
ncbi:hypothetical protein Q4512_00770 [Oceanihabitans sp. 2_MG-2023]|uniref:hypothetical protein n=1 Tax=Oceanihabitans sp. 2_MG-2023 TaxID=3062661 RepID=UPI0026E3052D|nr:hypothetical protein [Oceanihabitans sp. 2_MG-2023]MDO6595423.1 hypothetical protein [Oceanihabitans sp. 2_MG-2023]